MSEAFALYLAAHPVTQLAVAAVIILGAAIGVALAETREEDI